MGLFTRRSKKVTSGVSELLLQGQDMIEQTTQAHVEGWGVGSAQRWDLDPEAGVLRWTFDDRTAEAPVQVLGTYSPSAGSWMWAWANTSFPPHLVSASDGVRQWGEANGQAFLTRPTIEVDPEQADDVAAVAFRVSRATGFYRAPAGASFVYLTFGAVTVTPHDGEPKTFSISVD